MKGHTSANLCGVIAGKTYWKEEVRLCEEKGEEISRYILGSFIQTTRPERTCAEEIARGTGDTCTFDLNACSEKVFYGESLGSEEARGYCK